MEKYLDENYCSNLITLIYNILNFFEIIGPKKSSAGYNLTDLFIGSEGTLGIITSATMKLHPMPEAVSAAICHFPTNEAAVNTVVQTMQSSLPIARIELLDTESVKVTKLEHLDILN